MDNIQKPIQWDEDANSTLDFDYKQAEKGKAIIKVVGVGGGGSNAVRHMYQEGIQDVSFLIINTDYQALKGSPIPNKLQISEKGLGAGAKPEVAREYAEQYKDQIKEALSDGTEMVFITAGMGGGTGTGAAPIVARIAHELGILTVGIVTIPFEFEGRDKIIMALNGVAEIKKYVDALLVVNNNRLIDIYPDFNFFNAFKKADDTLTVAAKSISDIINIEGYMNLDFADVSTTLRNGGVALISTGQASGEGRVSRAIKEATTSPLLQDNDIRGSKHLLFELCFSESNPVSMSEIAELNDFVKSLNADLKVIWGAMVDNSLGDDVKLIMLASGFDMDNKGEIFAPRHPIFAPDPEIEIVQSEPDGVEIGSAESVEKVADEEKAEYAPVEQPEEKVEETPVVEVSVEETPVVEEPVAEEPVKEEPAAVVVETPVQTPIEVEKPVEVVAQPVEVEKPVEVAQPAPQPEPEKPVEDPKPTPAPATNVMQGIDNIATFYGEEMANKMRLDVARKAYYVLDNDDLTNEELIAAIEDLPAYNRSVEELGELKDKFKK